ncbi:MAG: Holliday junction resolvase RuvX [bacterium]
MRILCLDIGSKRIGVAATDPMGWSAQGIAVIERRGGAADLDEIEQRCRELEADLLLVGLPLDAEGGVGPAAAKVQAFAEKLRSHLAKDGIDIPMEFWDERYSTVEAEERLIAADVSRAKRKRVIDKMAAVAILEDYLASHAGPASDDEGAIG